MVPEFRRGWVFNGGIKFCISDLFKFVILNFFGILPPRIYSGVVVEEVNIVFLGKKIDRYRNGSRMMTIEFLSIIGSKIFENCSFEENILKRYTRR